jgi:uncharacterized membrane protein YdjX (TVP38/TMEM64 family)
MLNRTERVLRWSALAALVLALILVPFALFEQPLNEWSARSLHSAQQQALLAVATVLLLVADVLLPIPSSVVAAAAIGWLGPLAGGGAVWLGLTLAASFGYALGRFGGSAFVRRIVGETELERAAQLMNSYGSWMILVCRGVPVLAEASTLFAGATGFAFGRFLVVSALGNLGLAAAYATSQLFELGEALSMLVPFALGIVVPGLFLVVVRRFERRSQTLS